MSPRRKDPPQHDMTAEEARRASHDFKPWRGTAEWDHVEHAFFAAGDALADAPPPVRDSFDDLT